MPWARRSEREKRSEVDRRTYERASAVIINDWESVIDNDQTELLEPLEQGVIGKEQIHQLGDLLTTEALDHVAWLQVQRRRVLAEPRHAADGTRRENVARREPERRVVAENLRNRRRHPA